MRVTSIQERYKLTTKCNIQEHDGFAFTWPRHRWQLTTHLNEYVDRKQYLGSSRLSIRQESNKLQVGTFVCGVLVPNESRAEKELLRR